MRILILTAFADEIVDIKKMFSELHEIIIAGKKCFLGKKYHYNILLSVTGIGTTAAAHITTILCENFKPNLIIMCGVAGGLKENQKIGDLIIGNKIIDADLFGAYKKFINTPYENCLIDSHTSQPTTTEFEPKKELINLALSVKLNNVKSGIIATSNFFPLPQNFFENTKEFDADVIEMESAGIYKSAACFKIPVISIRAISNLINLKGDDLGTESNSIQLCAQRLKIFVDKFLNLQLNLEPLIREIQFKRIKEIITKYSLIQHPEGGWYKQTFQSEDLVKVQGESNKRYNDETRTAGTSIIYLLPHKEFSSWHTLQSDETWNFHAGSALILRILNPKTKKLKTIILGYEQGLLQYTIKAGYVFSAESTGVFSLCGCVVTPGFDFKDFKLLTKLEFENNFPEHLNLIKFIR